MRRLMTLTGLLVLVLVGAQILRVVLVAAGQRFKEWE